MNSSSKAVRLNKNSCECNGWSVSQNFDCQSGRTNFLIFTLLQDGWSGKAVYSKFIVKTNIQGE